MFVAISHCDCRVLAGLARKMAFLVLLLTLLLSFQTTLSLSVSRRAALGALTSSPLLLVEAVNAAEPNQERDALLSAIARGADETTVMEALNNLITLDPSRGKITDNLLDGEWKLLWSVKAEAFSPLLQLPRPFKPTSYQYFGNAAASEVGANRVAQGLTGGLLGRKEIWLSSGVTPSEENSSTLTILPPFRLQVGGRPGTGEAKQTLVEAGSDADFRAVNARSKDAQAAPRNEYQQVYVEDGGAGALRISTIVSGDPVIVGAIFVHEKL